MNLPKLKIRPTSQQSCARFGGVYHNPAAPIGTWYDERNLCSDMYPNAIACRRRYVASKLDGNQLTQGVATFCGGEHLVILDTEGKLWSNGYFVDLGMSYGVTYHWEFTGVDYSVWVVPASGQTEDGASLGGLLTAGNVIRTIRGNTGPDELPSSEEWVIDGKYYNNSDYEYTHTLGPQGEGIDSWYFPALGFEVKTDHFDPFSTIDVTLTTWGTGYVSLQDAPRMVRMGAYVYLLPQSENGIPMFANAVKLASGTTMRWGDDYGNLSLETVKNGSVDLVLCDIDGNPYNGVVVQDYQPAYQEGYWLDTSQETPVLREWNYLSAAWIQISSTFVKINPVQLRDLNCGTMLKTGDAVTFETTGLPDTLDKMVVDLLNSHHYLYKVFAAPDDMSSFIVVSGILPNDAITVSGINLEMKIKRPVPKMDFVVESGNRLWGCRYDEAASINEIYASKLGDPTNWQVYQGLSTDSWTASRGVAAPFTGAAVLDGHPLFFREESLEKVYPSSSGAHQIQTFDLEGVEQGAADSLCVIEDRLYYKSRTGVMVYTGSLPRRISVALGDMEFTGGSGARHQRKYCLSTTLKTSEGDEAVVLVYDTSNGDWHIETNAWEYQAVTWKDNLYYIADFQIWTMAKGTAYGRTIWWAETAPQAIHDESAARSLTMHKWISYLRIRFRLLPNGESSPGPTPIRPKTTFSIYISYENGEWKLLRKYSRENNETQDALRTFEMNFLPRRMDNFRLRLEGEGPAQIYDIAWRMEKSEAGH